MRKIDLFKYIKFPINSGYRSKVIKQKTITGQINLKFIKKYNFYYNKNFNSNKIIYDKNYNNDQSCSNRFNNHLRSVLKVITKKFDKKSSIIEIGCGKGFFFQLLKKKFRNLRGFDSTYTGNDLRITKRHIDIKDIIYEDLIVIRHTLEHIPNHYQFLKMLKKISINNPYILIEVPDFEWTRKTQSYFDMNYEHVNMFSKKTFQCLFKNPKIKNLFNKQYLIILAKLNTLVENYDRNLKETNTPFNKLFPKFFKKIQEIKIQKKNLYLWGGGSKGPMFLLFLKYASPELFKRVKYIVDIDPKKQNQYTEITNKLIIAPEKMFKTIQAGDTILVANSIYLDEIKKICKKNISKKLYFKTIDLNLKLKS